MNDETHKNSKKHKSMTFKDSNIDILANERPQCKKKFYQYHGMYIHFMDKYTTANTLVDEPK